MAHVNREYKDRLFKFIFGNPDNKEWTLSLYNAVNGSHYERSEDIELTTIEDVVYMGMKNDVSFLVEDAMSMYEHQSAPNPNLPMRFLIYAGMLYGRYVETSGTYHRFSTRLQRAPVPRCVCFYNGTADAPDQSVLLLRDAFGPGREPDIDVRVTMLNVNWGRNRELMEACAPLGEYAWFVGKVRERLSLGGGVAAAVDATLDEMPEGMAIKPLLVGNRAEVTMMCLTEYDEARTLAEAIEDARLDGQEMGREEGMEQGRAEGLEQGRAEGMEQGRAEGMKQGRAEGMEQGLEKRTDQISQLYQLLEAAGRTDEFAAAMTDRSLLDALLAELGLA